jgi:hypothetical protein
VEALAAVRDAQKKLPKDGWPEARYNAACAFALAASGAGDASKLGEKERRPLREQAQAWLREELARYEKLANQPDAESRQSAVELLRQVKVDSDFDHVRDPKALANLPEAERQRWQQFWQDVDAAMKKAQAPKTQCVLHRCHDFAHSDFGPCTLTIRQFKGATSSGPN